MYIRYPGVQYNMVYHTAYSMATTHGERTCNNEEIVYIANNGVPFISRSSITRYNMYFTQRSNYNGIALGIIQEVSTSLL